MTGDEKKVVLTGATGGIGSVIAQALANEDYRLLLTGRSEQKLKKVLSTLAGGGHTTVSADLTTPDGIDKLTQSSEIFRPTGLINCLGINALSLIHETAFDDIASIISTNLMAPMCVCRALLPQLKGQHDSFIVNVGSILGSIGCAGSTIYCASKFGLRGFTESLRRELSHTSVRVLYFAPRATATELNTAAMDDMNRELGNKVDHPSQVAQKLVDALRERKVSDQYLGWPESFFVKVNAIAPSVVDKALTKQLPTIERYCALNDTGVMNS